MNIRPYGDTVNDGKVQVVLHLARAVFSRRRRSREANREGDEHWSTLP
ncbi:MAG: hypothetical protein MZU97_05760 [Bacillus subtilis]|nr:hypothetical protein [Bacillus subtilis]